MKKKALIFGVTGQDGAYSSKYSAENILCLWCKTKISRLLILKERYIYKDINYKSNFVLLHGDLTDASSILNLIKK